MENKYYLGALCLGFSVAIGLSISLLISEISIRHESLTILVFIFAIIGLSVIIILSLANNTLKSTYLVLITFLLIGYAFMGKGFAYIGLYPIFIGEIALIISILMIMLFFNFRLFELPHMWLLVIFFAWGLIRTLPYVNQYGLDAFRDGVIWGYSLFAVAIACIMLNNGYFEKIISTYKALMVLFILWAPMGFYIASLARYSLLSVSLEGFNSVNIVVLKPGDLAVHLSAVMVFLALKRINNSFMLWLLWLHWVIATILVISMSRAAFTVIFICFLVLIIMKTKPRFKEPLVILLIALLIFFVTGLSFSAGRDSRSISLEQMFYNARSIVSEVNYTDLAGTRYWRLSWWSDIVNYTIKGDYFWGGKGYGVNLAIDDGYIGGKQNLLRSPHNGHLTILARSGVPGFIIWVIMQLAYAYALIKSIIYFRNMKAGDMSFFGVWLFVYWLAFMINTTFDVFLEGPQGGIWFWVIYGIGLTYINNYYELKNKTSNNIIDELPSTSLA